MNYLISDFERIWQIIYGKIKRNPSYLRNVKIEYEKMFSKFKKLFFLLDKSDLPSLSDTDLLRLLKQAIKAQRWSVGLGHVLESLSQGADAALRSSLEE